MSASSDSAETVTVKRLPNLGIINWDWMMDEKMPTQLDRIEAQLRDIRAAVYLIAGLLAGIALGLIAWGLWEWV